VVDDRVSIIADRDACLVGTCREASCASRRLEV
jgi:hypothetical protein